MLALVLALILALVLVLRLITVPSPATEDLEARMGGPEGFEAVGEGTVVDPFDLLTQSTLFISDAM